MSQSSMSVRLVQTRALIGAAYRELNAKKLFWVTLVISLVVVTACALLGINERGVSFATWTIDSDLLNTTYINRAEFYKGVFVGLAVPYWLAWPAIILALISTAGITPEFVSPGTVDIYLSKPVSRMRLFLTRYITALMFVSVQVLIFSFGWFILIGVRADDWAPSIFLAVPLVVLLYSYLYCVCVLVGILTRSTMAALLLTLVLWLGLWAGNWADLYFLGQREGQILDVEDVQSELDYAIESQNSALIEQLQGRLDQEEREAARASKVYGIVLFIRTVLPKTSETTNLLERYTLQLENEDQLASQQQSQSAENEIPGWLRLSDPRVAQRIGERRTERSVVWIIGSSLVFEFFVLGLATLVFVRRDF